MSYQGQTIGLNTFDVGQQQRYAKGQAELDRKFFYRGRWISKREMTVDERKDNFNRNRGNT